MKNSIKTLVVGAALAAATMSAVPAQASGFELLVGTVWGVMVGRLSAQPTPPASDCQPRDVKAEGANYVYTSYAHCQQSRQ